MPDDALRGGTVERVLRALASNWSEKWFARQLVGLLDPALSAHRDDGFECRTHGSGLSITVSSEGRLALAGLMLDANVDRAVVNAADRRFLEGLAGACIDDLCDTLAQAFGFVRDGWRQDDVDRFALEEASFYRFGATADTPLVELEIGTDAAVALIKARSAPSAVPEPLRSIADALAGQAVEVCAHLGDCSVSLSDFSRLEPGDVVVLDHMLADPLALAVAGRPGGARCSIEQAGDHMNLKIIKPLRG